MAKQESIIGENVMVLWTIHVFCPTCIWDGTYTYGHFICAIHIMGVPYKGNPYAFESMLNLIL